MVECHLLPIPTLELKLSVTMTVFLASTYLLNHHFLSASISFFFLSLKILLSQSYFRPILSDVWQTVKKISHNWPPPARWLQNQPHYRARMRVSDSTPVRHFLRVTTVIARSLLFPLCLPICPGFAPFTPESSGGGQHGEDTWGAGPLGAGGRGEGAAWLPGGVGDGTRGLWERGALL